MTAGNLSAPVVSEGSTRCTTFVAGDKEEDYEDLYDAEVGR